MDEETYATTKAGLLGKQTPAAEAPAKKRAARKKKVVQSDSDDEGGDALAENVPRARSTRPRRGVRA